ncbi:hypothetical protein B4O97_18705 [Marispirochaeta aestuarii]|uniref:Uncharacterized protein n=1 Tax=Marispirochaeta aestuarii TaxID=1963862 RepID=A0A1Y1RTY5_9SPIO|nr:hypothetical protein [Marispirochaeta aestuarii]ORC29885.1 hypothetical protein B4O97_18705 [Marispirochaeta aestuarii]
MRRFTIIERKIINFIIKMYENQHYNCLYNLLFDIDGIIGITHHFYLNFEKKDEVHFFFEEATLNEMTKDQRKIKNYINEKTQIFANTIEFIQYLIDEKYLTIIESDNKSSDENPKPNQGYIHTSFVQMSTEFQRKFYKHEKYIYIPTQKLFDLVNNKFIDENGIREKNEKFHKGITLSLAIISILIALGSLFLTILNNKESTEPIKVEIINTKPNP